MSTLDKIELLESLIGKEIEWHQTVSGQLTNYYGTLLDVCFGRALVQSPIGKYHRYNPSISSMSNIQQKRN